MKSLIRSHPKPITFSTIALLACLPTFSLVGCGKSAAQTFNKSLKPVAAQSATIVTQASDTVSRCNDDVQHAQLNNLPAQVFEDPAITSVETPNAPDKLKEMASCPREITQTQAAITSARNDIKALAPPASCDTCQSASDSLDTALADASSLLTQESEAITLSTAILHICDEELSQLETLPKTNDLVTEDDWKRSFSSTATIYGATEAKWQALTAPADFKQSVQNVIAAKQAEVDVAQGEAAAGLTGEATVLNDLLDREAKAGQQALNAVQTTYDEVQKKLSDLDGSLKLDKASIDQIVSNLG